MAARRTPWEIAFGPDRYSAEVFPAIRRAALDLGVRAAVPDVFLMMEPVREQLHELIAGEEAKDPPADELLEYGALLFHAFRFWSSDRALYVLTDDLARSLLGTRKPVGDWALTPPAPAGYVQLPRHLLWARVAADVPPEPVDGFFWSVAGIDADDEPPWQRLDLLFALGLRPDRPGFSIIDVTTALPAPTPGHFGDLIARETGDDFANILPGGEMKGLHGVIAVAEALKLASRTFHHMAVQPATVGEPQRSEGAPADVSFELPPSALMARTVHHGERSD
jgi:hypothetical protein